MVAQGSHASISFLSEKLRNGIQSDSAECGVKLSEVERAWILGSFFKICLGVDNEAQLLDIKRKAEEAGLEVNLITDQGHTEFKGVPTNTCLAIGPDYAEKIDLITGNLKLL